jgi:site-specific DNA recombinase
VAHAREFAVSKGWTVDPAHIYIDDAISGFEYARLSARDQLIEDAKKGMFQALIVMEQFRLGRQPMEAIGKIFEIAECDVRMFEYMTRTEISVANENDQLLTIVRSIAGGSERRHTSRRVHDAALQRFRRGWVTGGTVFGYDNVKMTAPTTHSERRINAEQAKIVGRIFEQYASGLGSTLITDHLNREKIPSPRPSGWRLSAVLYILENPLYRGEDLWKRHRNTVRKGKARHEERPEQDWERRTDERLRIVSDALWNAVQERRASRQTTIPRSPRSGKLLGRPSWFDGFSNHLVSGFGTCGVCNGNIRIDHQRRGPSGRGKTRRVVKLYRCGTSEQRGVSICSNRVRVPQEALDEALRAALRGVLHPDVIAAGLAKAIALLRREQASSIDRRTQIEKDLGVDSKEDRPAR